MSPVYFGKYTNRNMTFEELMFRDAQYVCWIFEKFDETEPAWKCVKHLMEVASMRPITARCSAPTAENPTGCGEVAGYVCIPPSSKGYDPKRLLFSCEACRAISPKMFGKYDVYDHVKISFPELRYAQLERGLHDYHLRNLGFKFAEAYGILDDKGHLMKEQIKEFFEGDHA